MEGPIYLTNDKEIEGQKFVCLSILFRAYQEETKRQHEEYTVEVAKEMKELEEQRKAREEEKKRSESGSSDPSSSPDTVTLQSSSNSSSDSPSSDLPSSNASDFDSDTSLSIPSSTSLSIPSSTSSVSKFDSNFGTMKIRGVFGTYEEAAAHAKQLQSIDPYYNIWVGEVGKWLPLDPNPSSVKDQVYYEKELNEILGAERQHLSQVAAFEEARKMDLMKSAGVTKTSDSEGKKKKKKKKKKSKVTPQELEMLREVEEKEKETLSKMQNLITSKELELMEFNRKIEEIKDLQKSNKK